MRTVWTTLRTPLLAALLALGIAGAQGTLELAVDQAPVGLDPHLVTAFSSFAVIDQVYESLVDTDADLAIVPSLASGWEISEDGLSYTFTLKDDVTFHNGRAMTADDVVYSLERVLAEETGSPQASRFSQVASAEATDERTVRFTLSEAFAPFLANLTDLRVVAREVVEENGDLQQVMVGTGPFRFVELIPDTAVVLEAYEDYHVEGLPRLEGLRFNVVPEASTQAAGIRTGSYHLLPVVDPTTAQTLRNVPNVELLGIQDLAYSLLGVNTTRPPFDDPRVREALNLILDRAEIIEAVYFGDAVPGGPLSPGLAEWALDTGEYGCYATDVARGQQLLADAGVEDLEFEILTFGTIQVVSDVAQVIQAQLQAAGIDASVTVDEFGSFVQRWRNSDFDAFVSLNGGNPDPDGYLYRTFSTGGATNVFQYSDAEVDALLEEGRTTTDPAERAEVYAELQRDLACDGPVLHVAYGTLFSAVRDEVEGFEQAPDRNLRSLRSTSLR